MAQPTASRTHPLRVTRIAALAGLVVGLGSVSSLGFAQHIGHTDVRSRGTQRLGRVVFPNPGRDAAQAPFLRGVALAHNFSERAPAAFRAAQRADPGFALAYWLEAYGYRDPLGRNESLDSARLALRHLVPSRDERLARARTPRERKWGAAIEALFADDSVAVRTAAFADSMRALVRVDSSDVEALVFTSLALQSIPRLPMGRREAVRQEAAVLADRAFRLAPDHPGAAHAVIHVHDVNRPDEARRALDAARAYAAIAPDNGHALHMPSHIFLQLGLWEDIERSNRRASALAARARASRGRVAREWEWQGYDWHAFNWLHYALVQQGRLREARAMSHTARVVLGAARPGALDSLGSPDERFGEVLRAFPAAWVTGDWRATGRSGIARSASEIAALPAAPDVVVWVENAFWPGLASAARGDTAAAAAAVRRIRDEAAKEPAGTQRVARAAAWVAEIEGLAALATGDSTLALKRLAEAAQADDALVHNGPPRWWPGRELLGIAQLELGHPREAAESFTRTLERFPRRPSAQLGLARAALAAGDTASARRSYAALLETWRHADRDIPELAEAHRWNGRP